VVIEEVDRVCNVVRKELMIEFVAMAAQRDQKASPHMRL
jgi:hypothetical protein